jgi:hypothetical protein
MNYDTRKYNHLKRKLHHRESFSSEEKFWQGGEHIFLREKPYEGELFFLKVNLGREKLIFLKENTDKGELIFLREILTVENFSS